MSVESHCHEHILCYSFGSAASPTFGALAQAADSPSFGEIAQQPGAGGGAFGSPAFGGFGGQGGGAGFGAQSGGFGAAGVGFGQQQQQGGGAFGGNFLLKPMNLHCTTLYITRANLH